MANNLCSVVDAILAQPFERNSSALLNAMLVQVGLIKVPVIGYFPISLTLLSHDKNIE